MIATVRQRLIRSATLLDRRPCRRQALHFWIGVYTESIAPNPRRADEVLNLSAALKTARDESSRLVALLRRVRMNVTAWMEEPVSSEADKVAKFDLLIEEQDMILASGGF